MTTSVLTAPQLAPFVPYCFLACYVAFVLARPSRLHWFWVTVAGSALGLAASRFHLGPWVSGLGLAAAAWAVIAPLAGKKTVHPGILVLIAYPTIASVTLLALHPNGGMVLDRYLLAADGSLGLQPGFLAAGFLLSHATVRQICEVFYFGLPVAMVCLLHTASAKQVVYLSLLLAPVAAVGYAIFPVVGSPAAFQDQFPSNPPATDASFGSALFEPGNLPRNFMPSMHAAWGIALLLGAWPLGRYWRIGVLLYLAPMMFYAIASHYLVDILEAVPWTFAVWSAIKKQWSVLPMYVAMAAAGLIVIRFGLPLLYLSRAVPWALGVATIVAPVLLQRQLARKSRTCYSQVGS